MSLVLDIGKTGFREAEVDAHTLICGYACGLDMTRRDLQLVVRDKGRLWDLAKGIEEGSAISEIVPTSVLALAKSELAWNLNGESRQKSDVDKSIWSICELIADISMAMPTAAC